MLLQKRFKGEFLFQYLEHKLYPKQISTQKIQVRKNNLLTLNDFQRLLGDINWLRPHLKLTPGELKPLFECLKKDADPNSPPQLTEEGQIALQKVEEAINHQQIRYIDCDQ